MSAAKETDATSRQQTAAGKPLMDEEQAAQFLGVSVHFLRARRHRGGGPPFIKLSSRAVRYRPEDLVAYVREHRRASTSEDTNGGS